MKKILYFIILIILMLPIVAFAAEAKIIPIRTAVEGDCTLLGSKDKYLLVDTCAGAKGIQFLDSYFTQVYGSDYGSKIELSILISHYHIDHIAGLYVDAGIWSYPKLLNALKKGKIYLPPTTYLDNYTNYYNSHTSEANSPYTDYKTDKYNYIVQTATSKGLSYQVVQPGSSISKIGDIEVSIIGPVDNCSGSCIDKYTASYLKNYGNTQGHYLNDYSLVTMFKIGNVKYLSAGDIESSTQLSRIINGFSASNSFQEEKLVNAKCSELKADILKLNHHGLQTSNSHAFLNCVKPKYIFYSKDNSTDEEYQSMIAPRINEILSDWRFRVNMFSTDVSDRGGNGSFVYDIKDGLISIQKVSGISGHNSTNIDEITINYVNSDTNEVITTSKTAYSRTQGKYYHLDKSIKKINGYIYDATKNANLATGGSASGNITVKVYYKKTNYGIDSNNMIIKGIGVNTNGTTIINNLGLTEGNRAALYHNTTAGNRSDMIKTGDKLKFNLNGVDNTYTLVVKGDINGDGYLSKANAKSIAKYIVEGSGLSKENQRLAADYDGNGSIKMNDVVKMAKGIKTGWVTSGSDKYYYDNDGVMATGWCQLNSQKYYFDKNGKMVKSANVIGERLYYFDPTTGVMTKSLDNYSFDTTGYLIASAGWLKIDDNWFYSSGSNKFLVGWQQINNNWYYLDELGRMQTGLKMVPYNNTPSWFYFTSKGVMANGWQKVGDNWYYFYDGGIMAYGWQKVDDNWFYLFPDGIMATGWQKIDYNWYYFNPGGTMVSNTCKEIDGSQFCFNSSGICTSGSGC